VVMNHMKLVDAGPEGSVEYELYIAPGFSNLNSTNRKSKQILHLANLSQMLCTAALLELSSICRPPPLCALLRAQASGSSWAV
jgi:hypothetical protein